MAPFRPEEITLPARFLTTTAHFAAVLTVIFDFDAVVSSMLQINPDFATPEQMKDYDSTMNTLQGLSYAACACFGIEYITLFMGISMFFPPVMILHTVLHFAGTVLVVLFYVDNWNIESYIAFFCVFNAFPVLVEFLTLFFVTKFSFLKY